jgi:hypothetical protein
MKGFHSEGFSGIHFTFAGEQTFIAAHGEQLRCQESILSVLRFSISEPLSQGPVPGSEFV